MSASSEREDLITTLAEHRGFLLQTAEGLTEDQGRQASTVSELTIAALLKHVPDTEEQWFRFAVEGAAAFGASDVDESNVDVSDSESVDERFVLSERDTLEALRKRMSDVAAATEQVLRTADLDAVQLLPEAPWFEPGASWSVRRIALHMIGEISQHAGHADIIREAIDGQKTMG